MSVVDLDRVPPIEFEEALNEEQCAAVKSSDGAALVLAGAGSGKTRTLTYRVAWLLSQGVKPYQILLLTFTNKAAKEMLGRVEDLTGVPGYRFWGGTFHHIGQKILRIHGELIGLEKNYTIMDQGEAESLLENSVREIDPAWLKNKDRPKAKFLANVISLSRNTCRSVAESVSDKFSHLTPYSDSIQQFYDCYRKKKMTQQVVDYDDLLELLLELFEKGPDVLEKYQDQFKYILVDEYQDTNALQSRIVDSLAKNQQVMAVGDDAQCIYTWRGADFENIMSFGERYPGAQIHKIETNYRSTPEILNFANKVLENQPADQGYGKELKAIRESRQKPYFVPAVDTHQQAQFIVKRLKGLLDEGYNLSDVAVLYRAHYQAMDLQMELTKAGVPYQITSGVRFFEQAHIKDLVAQLRFVSNPKDLVAFQRVFCLLPKVGPKTAIRLFTLAEKIAQKENCSIIKALSKEAVMVKVPEDAKEDFRDIAYTLEDVEEGIGRASESLDANIDLFNWEEKNAASSSVKEEKASEELVRIVKEGWYEGYLPRVYTNWESRRDDLDSLVNFASKFKDLNEFLAQLSLLSSETSDKADGSKEDSLRLTTIHQAKGLEYPVVFVIGLGDGLFPLKRTIEQGDVEEERRLFYVAVTRAQNELYMTYPMIVPSGGNVNRLEPSRFIREVPEDCFEILYLQQ